MRHSKGLLALGLLAGILLVTGAQAGIFYVPSDGTFNEALDRAGPGDTIALAPGIHKLEGYNHQLPGGLIIRTDTGMPGGVVVEEATSTWGGWRDGPVFIMDTTLSPTEEVVIAGITFRDFTLTFGPNQYAADPIFLVRNGQLTLNDCTFDNYHGTAVKFTGGGGLLDACAFVGGHGTPAAVQFEGDRLSLENCAFQENTNRYPGDYIRGGTPGSVLEFIKGTVTMNGGTVDKNGPVQYLMDIGRSAYVHACFVCVDENTCKWQGRIAGVLQMDCCQVSPARWNVLPGGSFIIVDNGGPKAAVVSQTTWTDVKALFDE
jgi:hypothetical protein